jgi:hypothetical protein
MEVPVQLSQTCSFTVTSTIRLDAASYDIETFLYVRTDNNTFMRSFYVSTHLTDGAVLLLEEACTEEEIVKHVASRCHYRNAVLSPVDTNDASAVGLVNRIMVEWMTLRSKSSATPS